MSPPAAVVFDCDGVLVDSEPHSVTAWMTVLAAVGHPAGRSDVEACTGLGFSPTWEHLSAIAPLPPAEEVWPSLVEALEASFGRGLERFPDAMAVLERCEAGGIPVAVVSASPRRRLDLTLRWAGLDAVFAVSVSGDDVGSGKPAPDGYLRAAEALGLDPRRCVAIEDSGAGVASALAAGMRVIAVVRREEDRDALAATGARLVDDLIPEEVLG